jgi:hypothetical protein
LRLTQWLGQLRHLPFRQIDAPHAAAPLAIAPTTERLLIAGNGGEWRAEFDAERLETLLFHQNGDERRRLGKEIDVPRSVAFINQSHTRYGTNTIHLHDGRSR